MTTLACRRNPLRGLMRHIQCNYPSRTTKMHVQRLYGTPCHTRCCQYAASIECWATHRARQTTLRWMPARLTSHNIAIRVQGKYSLIVSLSAVAIMLTKLLKQLCAGRSLSWAAMASMQPASWPGAKCHKRQESYHVTSRW